MNPIAEMQEKMIGHLELRAEHICREHGLPLWSIRRCKVNGAYYGGTQLGVIEYAMHEVAHAIGLGRSPDNLTKRLSQWNATKLSRLPMELSDEMELAASAVTFLAGERLALWVSADRIISSCFRNMRKLVSVSDWANTFQVALDKPTNQQHATELADWMMR